MNILNKKFWVVTKASKISTLADICFTTDFEGLHIQYKGGLKHEDIVGIYIDEGEAERKAMKLLSAFDEPQTITVNSYVRTTDQVIDPTGDSDLKIPKGALCKVIEICNPDDWWGEFQLIVEHQNLCFALESGQYELATDIIVLEPAAPITVKELKAGAKIGSPIYNYKPYIILSQDQVVLAAGTIAEILKINDDFSGYYDDCKVEVRTHDLYLNDNSKI